MQSDCIDCLLVVDRRYRSKCWLTLLSRAWFRRGQPEIDVEHRVEHAAETDPVDAFECHLHQVFDPGWTGLDHRRIV